MKLRSCLGCGSFTETRYCPDCEAERPKRKPFTQRYPDWPKTKKAVIKRDNGVCWLCDDLDPADTADHVIPISKGGTHDMGNLKAAHKRCNNKRNNMDAKLWFQLYPKRT